jgi:hypothetical protein
MKIWQIEDRLVYPALVIGIGLLIYSQWGHWNAWLRNVGSLILIITLSVGLIGILIFALLYPGERKKRETLEQEIQELKNQLKKER